MKTIWYSKDGTVLARTDQEPRVGHYAKIPRPDGTNGTVRIELVGYVLPGARTTWGEELVDEATAEIRVEEIS